MDSVVNATIPTSKRIKLVVKGNSKVLSIRFSLPYTRKIKNSSCNSRAKKHSEVPGRHDRCHETVLDRRCHFDWKRHDMVWDKSVWDPSSRVWEATKRAFSVSTIGSNRHHIRYGNGWEGHQSVAPSVVMSELRMKGTLMNWTAARKRHVNESNDIFTCNCLLSLRYIVKPNERKLDSFHFGFL